MKIIETERLYMREFVMSDKADWAKVLSDPESMRFYPAPFSDEKVESWILWNIDNYRKYKHGLWAVIRKADGIFIGDCGITMQDIDGETVPEIGYHIIKTYCGNGYATEAARACKAYAFDVLGYTRIFSYTNVGNAASQAVARKLGMRLYKYFGKHGEKQIAQVAYNEN